MLQTAAGLQRFLSLLWEKGFILISKGLIVQRQVRTEADTHRLNKDFCAFQPLFAGFGFGTPAVKPDTSRVVSGEGLRTPQLAVVDAGTTEPRPHLRPLL